jgi:hypothetical protein
VVIGVDSEVQVAGAETVVAKVAKRYPLSLNDADSDEAITRVD